MKTRSFVVLTILALTALLSFAVPVEQAKNSNFLKELEIPLRLATWQGEELSQLVNTGEERYKFVNDIFARYYQNDRQERILLLILDAENFHHPGTCFSLSGFEVEELGEHPIPVQGKEIPAKALYVRKDTEAFLVLYWLTINGKQVDWTEQKWNQLWKSIFDQKDTGLMVRLDIPLTEPLTEHQWTKAAQLFGEIADSLPAKQTAYVFGNTLQPTEQVVKK